MQKDNIINMNCSMCDSRLTRHPNIYRNNSNSFVIKCSDLECYKYKTHYSVFISYINEFTVDYYSLMFKHKNNIFKFIGDRKSNFSKIYTSGNSNVASEEIVSGEYINFIDVDTTINYGCKLLKLKAFI